MKMPRAAWLALPLLASALAAGPARGQDYPSRPIRLLTTEAGGGGDLVARVIGQGISGSLEQPVVVDNRGIRSGEIVAKAAPDGHTLMSYGNPLWLAPFLRKNVPYDPVRDFSPITLSVISPNVLVVGPAVAAASVKELIALAKARPGALNHALSGVGSSNHLAAELFRSMAGIDTVHVPYRGAGPALTALIGGHVQIMFPSASSVTPHIKAGRLKALAVTSAEPSALAPGLPTVSASGLPGYESALLLGVFAPAGTPAALITRLNAEIVKVLRASDVKEKLFASGVEIVASSPAQFAARVRSEMDRLGKLIRDAGIRAD
ncbi:MAG: tripartite tricarboxylate transporter substrate binding protein [Betaproteobacteria bacterium]|nr:tripartite tricarboxylate transporter substrate binding protein [Betaproteobacteria bacterium]